MPPVTQAFDRQMKIIGNKNTFAFEIGAFDSESKSLRIVDIWANNIRLCIEDNTIYIPQFVNDLIMETKKSYNVSEFEKYLKGLSPEEMAHFVMSTRDEKSPNYDLCDDRIYPTYRFLDLGPTTDNITAFLFRQDDLAFLTFSFWREAIKLGGKETFDSIKLEFEQVISICNKAIAALNNKS